jgi:hypothetical protein
MPQQSATASDRRRFPRYENHGEITIRRVLSGPNLTGTLRDLSLQGCLIGLDQPVQLNPSDVIELKLRTNPLAFRVMGFVRHASQDGRIAGLEFHRVGEKDAIELASFIANLQGTSGSETFQTH